MVKYSARSARALAYLKRFYNDIDIFIEDTSSPRMWLRVLRSILPESIRITSVNMLGGRRRVLDACKIDQAAGSRPKLYIIDADLDHLTGRRKPSLKHLYRLRAYCVENLLIDEAAVLEVAADWNPERDEAQIARLVGYRAWIGELEKPLFALFVTYATVHALAPQVATVSFPVNRLIVNSRHTVHVDNSKVRQRMFDVARQACKIVGVRAYRDFRRQVSMRAESLTISVVVSGKDYILPLLLLHLQKRCRFKGGSGQLKTRLASSYSPKVDPWFARRLKRVAGQ